jgi:phosphoserine phosphatase RsbU/P
VVVTFEAGQAPLEVRVASAGHPAPLVRTAASSRDGACGVREVTSEGLLFGVGQPVQASTALERLEPGETLLLYTDGATDAPVENGGRLGDEGLRDLVRDAPPKPAGVVDTVITALRRGSRGRRDDIALIALGPTAR